MIFKGIGAVLIMLTSCAVSMMLRLRGKQTLTAFDEAQGLLRHIRRSIEAYLTPIETILAGYSTEYLDSVGFTDAMRTEGLCAAFSRSYLHLPHDAEELLISFASSLGSSLADSEVKRCEICLERLDEMKSAFSESTEKNRDLYRFLPPLGGISLIIILI